MQFNDEQKRIKRKTISDKVLVHVFMAVAALSAMAIAIIAIFIIYKGSLPFVKKYEIDGKLYSVNLFKFLVGGTWFKHPNIYGAGYIILNTVYVTLLALIIAVPISILTALFIVRIAPKKLSHVINTVIEILASIPSVIYGLFGMGYVTKIVKNISYAFGFQSAGGLSVLSTAIVLSMMILPTITMISVTAIKAVRTDLINGSLALGASTAQTNFKVVLTTAKSGIFSGVILGVGRALGEATAVSMVCGNSGSDFSLNPFDTTATLTSTMLMSIHETTGLDYDIRFSVGILLIVIIIVSNLLLNMLKNRIGKSHGKI